MLDPLGHAWPMYLLRMHFICFSGYLVIVVQVACLP